ncbi:hypothetical protein MSG28_015832 [Choristoneura fumiferana]|uniref:Uncharacterized protein n=1 Tax=Choristoneura fumiferana TaxID=7141 RepID=A0ACC0KCY0_CHOFU|nr:hypothetical protein MSG28_015832 [Choristoneura fumiferana]
MPVHPHYELLQTNANHSARAQDLLMQPNWVGDSEGLVAVVVPAAATQRISIKERGAGYVAAKWGEVVVIGVYFSPNRPFREFERFLAGLGAGVQRALPAQVVLMGDLNAKCEAWGCPSRTREGRFCGTGLQWSAGSAESRDGQHLRWWQGGSIVDVTFATPAIGARIGSPRRPSGLRPVWWVGEAEISQNGFSPPRPGLGERGCHSPGVERRSPDTMGVDERAVRFREDLTAICDAAMPRAHQSAPRTAVYWWSQDLVGLRAASDAARRAFTRCRRRRTQVPGEEERLLTELRAAKAAFQTAIAGLHRILASLDNDPWGRPYRTVRAKLKVSPPTEDFEPGLLAAVVEGLFPPSQPFEPPRMASPTVEPETPPDIPPITGHTR